MTLTLTPLLSVSAAEKSAMSDEELIQLSEKNAEIQASNFKAMEDHAKAEQEAHAKLKETVLKQGETIANLKLNPVNELDQLFGEKKEAFKKACAEKMNKDQVIFHIATKTVTNASIVDSTASQRLIPIGKQPVRRIFIEDLFNQATITEGRSGGKITYVDQNVLTRSADAIANCSPIPESDITWIEKSEDIRKIGDSIKVCRDTLEDYDFVQNEVDNFLRENLMLKLDQQLLLGTGVAPQFTSVDSKAQLWSVAAGSPIENLAASIPSPTTFDVVQSAICQIRISGESNNQFYNPNAILMNPADVCQMKLEKDADANYLLPIYFSNDGMFIDGVPVYETPLVPAGTIYVGDFTKGTVYTHRDMEIMMANQHATDFTSDLITIKGTLRKALVIRDVWKNAFLKVADINAAKAALAKP